MKKQFTFVILASLVLSLAGCGQSAGSDSSSSTERTAVDLSDPKRYSPSDASELKGMDYKDVSSLFKQAGFEKITVDPVDDIDSKSSIADGTVESVTINKSNDFTSGTEFDKSAQVVITYHNIPKIEMPLSPAEAASRSYMDAGKQFFDAGFRSVETDEVYDLSEGSGVKTVISVNGREIEDKALLPFDSEVSVIEHFPVSTYPTTITIDFEKNLLLSKYDVVVELDGTKLGTLPHGEDGKYSRTLTTGDHEIVFTSAKDSEITGKTEFHVNSKTDVTYKISCNSKNVKVEKGPFEHELKSGYILMPFSSSHYLRKDYQKVVEELEKQGFSKVSAEPVTDTLWNPDEIDSVVKIEIDGKSEFKHDEMLNKTKPVTVYYHVCDFAFIQNELSVTEKESFELDYSLNSDDPIESIDFKIDHPEVVQRNKDGTYTALKPGMAEVSVYTGSGEYSKCAIEVTEIVVPIEKIEFASEETEVIVGSTFKPEYKIIPENANYTEMNVVVSNDLIEAGEDLSFYSNGEGDSEISFYQDERLLGSCTVHSVYIEIEDLTLEEADEEIYIGNSIDLNFKLSPENATNKGIRAVSSNSNIAETEFDERGPSVVKVNGLAAGETVITISLPNGNNYTHSIIVKEIDPVEISVKNADPKQIINVGTPVSLKVSWNPVNTSVKDLTWSSSNSNVAKVDAEGNVEAVGVGTAEITGTHKSGISGTITLTVEPIAVTTLDILTDKDQSKKYYPGDSFTIIATVFPENATDKSVTYSSSNEAVAKVNANGVVTAIGAGTADITVSTHNHLKKKITFTVYQSEPETIRTKPTENSASNDDCGWVQNAAWEGGGYCSYHPEWYGLTSFADTNGQGQGSGANNYQTYNDPYAGSAPYIGNANSGVFHHYWCSSVSSMKPSNKVELWSRDDAVNYGYRPCQRCNP